MTKIVKINSQQMTIATLFVTILLSSLISCQTAPSREDSVYQERLHRDCPLGLDNCPEISKYISMCKKGKQRDNRIYYIDTTPFIIPEPHLCRGNIFLLAAVHSTPTNFLRRANIRKTWGSLRQVGLHRIQVAFFLGISKNADKSLQEKINDESDQYGDIIQRDYIEHYRNMTRKHMTVMEWTAKYCSNARYLLKLDDDTFVDIFHVIQFLVTNTLDMSFYCTATANAKPQRKPTGHLKKWTVTRAEYRPNKYPVYCEGLAYLMDAKLARALVWCATYTKFFWIDDVYVTGVLAEKMHIQRIQFWKGHSYTPMLPSHASSTILDYIFLMAANNEFMPGVWNKLWRAVLLYSMDLNI